MEQGAKKRRRCLVKNTVCPHSIHLRISMQTFLVLGMDEMVAYCANGGWILHGLTCNGGGILDEMKGGGSVCLATESVL